MSHFKKITFLLFSGFLSITAVAQTPQINSKPGTNDTAVSNDVLLNISKRINGIKPDSVHPSVIPGVYEVVFGKEVAYFDKTGRYFIKGDIYDVDKGENLTRLKKASLLKSVINKIDRNDFITYKSKNEKYEIVVFTDTDCPYCKKMHKDMMDYNNVGITVHYLPFPRAGAQSRTGRNMKNIWCSNDREEAFEQTINGNPVADVKCDFQIGDYLMLGHSLGVKGTPAVFTMDGYLLPGYRKADRLLSDIEKLQGKSVVKGN